MDIADGLNIPTLPHIMESKYREDEIIITLLPPALNPESLAPQAYIPVAITFNLACCTGQTPFRSILLAEWR